jgi:hypothetical protein
MLAATLAAETPPPPWGAERPAYGLLAREMIEGFSFIDADTRESMEASLRILDRANDALLRRAGVVLTPMPRDRADEWILQRTEDLPDLTPKADRVVLALIRLEIDLLHRTVSEDDPELGDRIHRRRTMIRVRPEQERIFGDYRDIIVALLVESFNQMAELQTTLGHPQPLSIPFPRELDGLSDVEYFAQTHLQLLAERSGELVK